jgi:flagellar motor switch protein FliN/FliY
MTLVDDLQATNDVALAVTSALEQRLGEDVLLAVGVAHREAPTQDLLPEGPSRAVSLPFIQGIDGEVALVLGQQLAAALEATASDELLTSSTSPALEAGASAMSTLVDSDAQLGRAIEVATDNVIAADGAEFIVYPLLQNDERVACLVIRIASTEPSTSVALHDFAQLNDATPGFGIGGSRPLAILKDVEMGVTAELGRRRMTVRDLLALTPGSVIELDRAAGSPVDVLVNGTLIARGEVVVIDEEFGIRIAEIVAAEPTGAS